VVYAKLEVIEGLAKYMIVLCFVIGKAIHKESRLNYTLLYVYTNQNEL
jgi:hypothetical protein